MLKEKKLKQERDDLFGHFNFWGNSFTMSSSIVVLAYIYGYMIKKMYAVVVGRYQHGLI
jgi:hypothetical protein